MDEFMALLDVYNTNDVQYDYSTLKMGLWISQTLGNSGHFVSQGSGVK